MKQSFKVVRIHWDDEISGQQDVELESEREEGRHLRCFGDRQEFILGERVVIADFWWFSWNDEDPRRLNPERERSVTPVVGEGPWDYVAKGSVIDRFEDGVFVDCGVVVLPYRGNVASTLELGTYVGFSVSRLEAERAAGS